MIGDSEQCQGLVPKLRFAEFRNAAAWQRGTLGDWLFEAKEKNRSLKFAAEDVLSVSGEIGCVNQIEFMGRSYAGASVKEYNIVETGDIVYTKSPLKARPNGIIKTNRGAAGIVSVLYAVYRPKKITDPNFIDYYFSSDVKLNNYLRPLVKKGPKNSILVNNAEVLHGAFIAPSFQEQQKIADCLSSLDAAIEAQAERMTGLKAHKKGLMQALFPASGQTTPRFRFPEFRGGGEWAEKALGDLIQTITPPKRLPTSQYAATGAFPIVDQSQDAVCGWTSDSEAVVSEGLPYIIFGDHTCVVKLALVPFAQGADGIKILGVNNDVSVEFLYQSLLNAPLEMEDYRRHFSILKERRVKFPDITTGEQQRIVDCLSSLDAIITATSDLIDALKRHKSGLMQQLFPSACEAGA